jgi:hypothetical protein
VWLAGLLVLVFHTQTKLLSDVGGGVAGR